MKEVLYHFTFVTNKINFWLVTCFRSCIFGKDFLFCSLGGFLFVFLNVVSSAHNISLPHIDDMKFHPLVKMASIIFFHCRDTFPPFKLITNLRGILCNFVNILLPTKFCPPPHTLPHYSPCGVRLNSPLNSRLPTYHLDWVEWAGVAGDSSAELVVVVRVQHAEHLWWLRSALSSLLGNSLINSQTALWGSYCCFSNFIGEEVET